MALKKKEGREGWRAGGSGGREKGEEEEGNQTQWCMSVIPVFGTAAGGS